MTAALRRCHGTDLDAATLYDLLTLRVEVFVVENPVEDGIPHVPMLRAATA